MKTSYINFEQLHRLSKTDSHVSLENKVIKLFEEGGELSQEVLKYVGSPNASKSAKGTKETVLEEACDTINVVMDIVNLVADDEEAEAFVREIFAAKLNKWERKTKEYS